MLLALTALSALAAAVLAAIDAQWFTLGFEVVVLLAALLGIFAAGGRPPYGQPLALVCVAGAVAAASFLESVGVNRSFLGILGRPLATLQASAVTVRLDVLLLFRLAAAGALGGVSGALLIRREPRSSRRQLLVGLALAAAAVGILAGAWLGRSAIVGLAGPIKWGLGVVCFIVVTALVAAAGQHLIHAFSAKRT